MKIQLAIMKALVGTAEAENRALTEDEQAKFDAAEAEYNRLLKLEEQKNKLKEMQNAIPVEPAHEPAPMASSAAAGVQVGRNLAATREFENVGEMLHCVMNASNNSGRGGESMERLVNLNLNTETGADGGFLVPEDFIGDMMSQAVEQSQLFKDVTEIQLSGNTASIPGVDETSRQDGQRYGGVSVNWVAEGSDGNYTKPKFRNWNSKLSKLMGLVAITDEMMEDSTLLTSWVQKVFPEEMAFEMDLGIWEGSGNGIPLGFMNSDALVEVAKETGQGADTVVYENIVKMASRVGKRLPRCKWYITEQVMEQLPLMNLSVGTGGLPVFLPPGGASAAPFGTLYGRPIEVVEQANKLGDSGDIVLADLSDYLMIAKGGIKTASSIHVFFNSAQTAFRFIKRANGAPYTKTKLQSRANSDFYTSPYVALADRA